MKKKIVILGSTGSIGKTTLKIIDKNKKDFYVDLLSTNKNFKKVFKQALKFNVKNILIHDKETFENISLNTKVVKKNKFNIFNSIIDYKKKLKTKIDFTMCAISGIEGLQPTINSISFSKKIGIANKESIICGWSLINKKLNKFKTQFVPIDSEHFSINQLIKDKPKKNIKMIYLTASGGPFLNYKISQFKNISLKNALKHPSWLMGKKITIDSATMMNKVFEVIEAKNLFKIPYKKIKILTHPKSYIHAIVHFNNGIIELLAHQTSMEIPIANSIYDFLPKKISSKPFQIDLMNDLKFSKIDLIKFPILNCLKLLPHKHSLFETILITANDYFVYKFIHNEISFTDISTNLIKFIKKKEFTQFKHKTPKSVEEIKNLHNYVSLKLRNLGI